MILKNIPNALTLLRLALIAPFLLYLYNQEYEHAFYVFIFAGFTDGLDGWLARQFKWQSYFGSFVDPLADKLLVASSFISLALLNALPWWLVVLVFLRDFSISLGVVIWMAFIDKKLNFKPTLISKFNTTFQLMLVTLCLFELAYSAFPDYIRNGLIILTTFTTAISYFDYMLTWGRMVWSRSQTSS